MKDELQLIKKGTRSIAEYSQAFKTVCDQLSAMGCPVDDTNKVHWFLQGLSTRFSSFSTTIMSHSPIPSFKDVVPKAQSHDLFVKSFEKVNVLEISDHATAFTAQRAGNFSTCAGRNNRGGGHSGRGGGRNNFSHNNNSNS